MAVSDATITTTTAAAFIPEIWVKDTIDAIEYGATIQKRVNRSYESALTVGNTLHVPRLSNLTTQVKSTGISNTIVFEAITETKQDITVSTQEYAAFMIESLTEVQANQDLRSKYAKKVGYALARGRDVALAALFQNLTQIVGTYGLELSSDDYLLGWQKLAEAGLLETSTDPGEDFSIFLSPAAYAAALKVDVFINRQYNPEGNAIQRARIGQIYGMETYLSNLLRSPSAGQHDNAMFHRECFALIVQKEVPMVSDYLIRNLADAVAGWNVYGIARILFPPETPGGGSATDSRGVLLKSV